MRVLFLGPLPDPITGQSLACQVFLDELIKHHHVDVVNMTKRGFKQGVSSFTRILEVVRILLQTWRKSASADVIYFTVSESYAGNAKDLLIYLLCFKRLPRMVIHLHGGAGIRRFMLSKRSVLRRVNEMFLRRVGGAIVLGPRHVDVFRNALPMERIHVVPNFADEALFADTESIERKFHATTPLRILFLSNLLPGKGHLELLDAFFAIDEGARRSIVIDFAGAFESDEQERVFLGRINDVPQIRYHGTVRGEQRRGLFHQAHVFCLPTYYPYEGQPLSILEAYASGCAVITTDHSGIRDVFAPEANGFEVAKRSSTDLAAAIERAIASPGTLHAMATTNVRTAELKYRTSTYNANMLRVIESVGTASSL